MRMQPTCVLVMGVLVGGFAQALPARAARRYLGLAGGANVAYVANAAGTGWVRDAAADLPDVGYYGAPALADLDGDGDRDALVGESAGRVLAYQNSGGDAAPVWIRQPGWDP